MKLVSQLKAADQDHEFYPTTNEIIAAIVKDLKRTKMVEKEWFYRGERRVSKEQEGPKDRHYESVLDIGAGNGKVLAALHDDEELSFSRFYAIEKSPILIQHLPDYVFTVGTEFHEQSLYSKPVDVIICNPPYSQYTHWMNRILREAAAKEIYFVVPKRWKEQPAIADTIKGWKKQGTIVGSFDFEDAEDRTARAKVDLVRFNFSDSNKDQAFEKFFNEEFADLLKAFGTGPKPNDSYFAKQERMKKEAASRFESLVPGEDYADRLVRCYMEEMTRIRTNCGLIAGLDAGMLKEFDIHPDKILACLKEKLQNLKHDYWNELFSRMSVVTDRLTSGSREKLLNTLRANTSVDFTLGNIQAILLWVIRQANLYYDSQLIETYELMIDKANVRLYKSNLKPFVWDRWRYNSGNKEENSTHFCLEYRIVMHSVGGIRVGYSFERGLDERACRFLGDMLTIARNLKFNCTSGDNRLWHSREGWVAGEVEEFHFIDPEKGYTPLIEVRAFKNGNLHLRLNQDFALALNVEYGRLKGWLRSGGEAAMELRDMKAAKKFKSNFALTAGVTSLLLR